MSASKDGTMKIYVNNLQLQNLQLMPQFSFSEFELDVLINVDENHILAYSEDSWLVIYNRLII